MQNEKIIALGVGKDIVDAFREIVRSNIHGVGFAFTSMTDYVVDYYVDVPMKFHVHNLNDCEKIVKEKFSDTGMMFVFVYANEADELSLASKFVQEAKAARILTIGLVIVSGGFSELVNSQRVSNHLMIRCSFFMLIFVYAIRLITRSSNAFLTS